MSLIAKSREVTRVLAEFAQIAPIMANAKMPESDALLSTGAMFEDTVERYPENTMLICEGRQWTYREFNAEVNQLAHLLAQQGVSRGDAVSLLMENRAEFILAMLAVLKLGASVAMINNSLVGAALMHCIRATDSRYCIVGEERSDVLGEVVGELGMDSGVDCFWVRDAGDAPAPSWALDASAAMGAMSSDNLPVTQEITAGEPAVYIFTSGTTGMPKAAIMPHRKYLVTGQLMGKVGFRSKPTDRLYLCLPLYHITGLGPGFCTFIAHGGSIFLRRGFSASRFWAEVKKHQCNSFVYVGELCRYLVNQEPCPEERDNPLEKMMGNGLRPDVWDTFKQRFQVNRISEIYGSSEGNASFINLLNKDRTIGASVTPVALVKFDTEENEIVRDGAGRCIEVEVGEPGLLLNEISEKTPFDGYTNAEATAGKIVHDVLEEGDRWFNTGDLVKRVDVGFALGMKHYQFVDRTGDTFRWRAENVSTNEVSEILNAHPQIGMANVYGVEVPRVEGRAGMVAFELAPEQEFDLEAFQKLVEEQLPAYAQPVFIRLLRSAETGVTFKLLKGDLREQSYHPGRVDGDPIYVRKPRSSGYELLDESFYQDLLDGNAGY